MSSLLYNSFVDNHTGDYDNGSKQQSMHGPIAHICFQFNCRHPKSIMKSFLTACGVDDSLQLIVERESAHEGELRLLHQPFAVIGRDPRADVVLDHSQVSRRHTYLQAVNGRVFWVDLESRTGTRGERKSQKFGWLEQGRALCVGPYVIRRFVSDRQAGSIRAELPRDAPLVAPIYSHAPLPEVALEFLNGPSQSTSRPVHRVMSLIGSASGCKFRLTDPSVSRFHGSLLRISTDLWIVDLLGHRGITVNEVPVRSSRLADGDVLRIGRYQICVRCRLRCHESGNALPNRGRAVLVPRSPRQDPVSNGLKFPDRVVAMTPFGSGQEAQNALSLQSVSSFSELHATPSNAALPANLTQSDLAASMLAPVVNQFGLMQQQMFDQFQQAMAMMVQMFGRMHHDQMEVIRTELDQLRELTEEFHALKTELANRSRAEMASHDLATGAGAPDPTVAIEPGVSETTPVAALSEVSNGLGVGRVGSSPVNSTSPMTSSTPGQRLSLDPGLSHTPPEVGSPVASATSEQRQEPGLCPPMKPNAENLASNSERDTLAWLHQRIISLQRERESRWQKILKLLPGMS
jgi:pSer/pThr/pTyr-binding forkhead associated (FHA) protein